MANISVIIKLLRSHWTRVLVPITDMSGPPVETNVYKRLLHSLPSNEPVDWIRKESIGPDGSPEDFLASPRPSQPLAPRARGNQESII